MLDPVFKMARSYRIPTTFAVHIESHENCTVHYLVRLIDRRRIQIEWVDGEKSYTQKELSEAIKKDGDENEITLRGFLK